jgi:arabinan endo-1,5-alpha-L-arabinosidase
MFTIIPLLLNILVLTCPARGNFEQAVFTTAAWPVPHTVSGFNRPGTWGGVHLHDPSIVKGPDGKYYSFSTHGLLSTSRADSLSGPWQHLGSGFANQPSKIPLQGRNDIWAPDVSYHNGTYYAFYSVSTFGSQSSAIGVATSRTLLPGSWSDHGAVITSGKDKAHPLEVTNAIDACLFVDKRSGVGYLIYGSFWQNIWMFRLNADMKSVDKGWPARQLSYAPKAPSPEEGPFLHERDGWYYLWVSHGVCCGYKAGSLPAPGTEFVAFLSIGFSSEC